MHRRSRVTVVVLGVCVCVCVRVCVSVTMPAVTSFTSMLQPKYKQHFHGIYFNVGIVEKMLHLEVMASFAHRDNSPAVIQFFGNRGFT